MNERRKYQRSRAVRGGRILLSDKRSVIDCAVQDLSGDGACLQVESVVGIPAVFGLAIDGTESIRACRLIWQSDDRLGVAFDRSQFEGRDDGRSLDPMFWSRPSEERTDIDLVRHELSGLRAALDEVRFGVVLLDTELRAQLINRAFRKMWRLPDAKADSKPAFVALMYHGRDTRAYDVPEAELHSYVAERVAPVKAGNPAPRHLCLANGEVIRLECAVLPGGGRMLSYTYVTDIVRHSDELGMLRAALDNIDQGIILLDRQLNAQFMNRAVRKLAGVPDDKAERRPHYSELVNDARFTNASAVLEAFLSRRIALVRAGDPTPTDLRMSDGRTIRAHCATLPEGGRMLTYTDVTDLVRTAEQLERLATIDAMTGAYNRRHFLALAEMEWDRFQRYHRPLSLFILDIDRFKSINDRFGHDVGDRAIAHVVDLCRATKRSSDIVGRIGGDEFALLLPETDSSQAETVSERLRRAVADTPLPVDGASVAMTVSIGIARATLSQSGVDALMKKADQFLYQAKLGGRNRIARATDLPIAEYRAAAE